MHEQSIGTSYIAASIVHSSDWDCRYSEQNAVEMWQNITLVVYLLGYGIVEFNVPLDTV